MMASNLIYLKTPLNLELYEQFGISQYYEAYIIEFENITLERCDELEQSIILDGLKVFHTETAVNQNNFNIKFVVGMCQKTF